MALGDTDVDSDILASQGGGVDVRPVFRARLDRIEPLARPSHLQCWVSLGDPGNEEAAMSRPTFSDPVGVFALANVLIFFVCLFALPPAASLCVVLGTGVAVWLRISAVRHRQQGVVRTHPESVSAR
jgi:Flp pilus assembly protein TadB